MQYVLAVLLTVALLSMEGRFNTPVVGWQLFDASRKAVDALTRKKNSAQRVVLIAFRLRSLHCESEVH